MELFESSAKNNVNVTVVFERLVELICDRMSKSLDTNAAILNSSGGSQTKRLTAGPLDGATSSLFNSATSSCQQCWPTDQTAA